MNLRITIATAAAVAAAAVASSSFAQTYSAAGDFSSSNPSGVWSYGSGQPGQVTALANFSTNCFASDSGLSCFNNGDPNTVPSVGASANGGTATFLTPAISVPSTDLFLHPGVDPSNNADVVFTAPNAGSYTLAGYFEAS